MWLEEAEMLWLVISFAVLAMGEQCNLGGDFWCDVEKRWKREQQHRAPREIPTPVVYAPPEPIPRTICLDVPSKNPVILIFTHNQEVIACIDGEEMLRTHVSTGRPTRKYLTQPSDPRRGLEPVTFIDRKACSERYPDRFGNCTPMPDAVYFGWENRNGEALHASNNISRNGLPPYAPYGKSHGCTRLSPKDARYLYGLVEGYSRFGPEKFESLVRVGVFENMRAFRAWPWSDS